MDFIALCCLKFSVLEIFQHWNLGSTQCSFTLSCPPVMSTFSVPPTLKNSFHLLQSCIPHCTVPGSLVYSERCFPWRSIMPLSYALTLYTSSFLPILPSSIDKNSEVRKGKINLSNPYFCGQNHSFLVQFWKHCTKPVFCSTCDGLRT